MSKRMFKLSVMEELETTHKKRRRPQSYSAKALVSFIGTILLTNQMQSTAFFF